MKDDLPIDRYQQKLGSELHRLSNKSRICLFKDNNCKKKIIKAHSIPVSSLKMIATKSKELYQMKIVKNSEFDDIHQYSTITPKGLSKNNIPN